VQEPHNVAPIQEKKQEEKKVVVKNTNSRCNTEAAERFIRSHLGLRADNKN
jgi:hypothetical protein